MSILPIIKYPDPILEAKTKKITDFSNLEIKEIVFDMLETMEASENAVGLAANQVGKSIRLCVIKFDNKTHILINPKIKSKSWRKEVTEEGCLSFPEKYIPVKRSRKVKVEFQNRKGEKNTIEAEGFLARILQHEIDHLDGILYTSRKVKTKK